MLGIILIVIFFETMHKELLNELLNLENEMKSKGFK